MAQLTEVQQRGISACRFTERLLTFSSTEKTTAAQPRLADVAAEAEQELLARSTQEGERAAAAWRQLGKFAALMQAYTGALL